MIKKTTGHYIFNSSGQYELNFISNVILINDNGDEIERNSYNDEGDLDEKQTISYSTNGVVISVITDYIKHGTKDAIENVLDDNGIIIASINSFSDGETEYEYHHYSELGIKVKTSVYDENEVLHKSMEFHYDVNNNLIKESIIDKDGIQLSAIENEYQNGQRIKESFYLKDKLNEYVVYNFNEENEICDVKRFDGENQLILKEVNIKKDFGSITISRYGDDELTEENFQSKIVFDLNDVMISSIYYFEGERVEEEYKYDELGRLIKEITTEFTEFGPEKSMFLHVYEEV